MSDKPLITPRDPYWRERHSKGEKTHSDQKKAEEKKKCRKKINDED